MAVIILFLLVSPALLLSPMLTFIDIGLFKSSRDEVSVQTKADFGNQEVMASFPKPSVNEKVGIIQWNNTLNY